MAAAVDSVPGLDAPPPDGLSVQRVTNVDRLADYATVLAANWRPPAETVLRFTAETAPAALSPDCASVYLVGYLDSRPVACAEVFHHAGVAGLYNLCTLARFRRLGYGTALALAALRTARDHGYTTVTLQTSTEGERVCRKLGFTATGHFTEHAVSPPEEERTEPHGRADDEPSADQPGAQSSASEAEPASAQDSEQDAEQGSEQASEQISEQPSERDEERDQEREDEPEDEPDEEPDEESEEEPGGEREEAA
jgi:ribosomal protein S18 acetylase RimI-like enzyme